jgi:putative addiction module component (TIGR02574 family)
MTLTDIIKEINKLDLSQRILLVEDIWDSIALNNSELPIPDWQKRELDKRYRVHQSGNLPLEDLHSVHAELRAKST